MIDCYHCGIYMDEYLAELYLNHELKDCEYRQDNNLEWYCSEYCLEHEKNLS